MIVVENFPRRGGAIISKIIFHGLVTVMVVKGLHLARPSSRPLLPLLVWWQGMSHGFRAPFNPWGACWEEREEGGTREGGVEGGGRRREREGKQRVEMREGRREVRRNGGKERELVMAEETHLHTLLFSHTTTLHTIWSPHIVMGTLATPL